LPVFEAEGPVVPGADGAAVFDVPRGEVAAGVGAAVVDDSGRYTWFRKTASWNPPISTYLALAFLEFVEVHRGCPGHGGMIGDKVTR
jgi:hypothetical protein